MRKLEIKHPDTAHCLTHDSKRRFGMADDLKSSVKTKLKEIVLEAVLKVMNEDTKVI